MAAGWSTAVRKRIRLCESVRYTDGNRINGVPSPMGAAATVRGAIAERWRLLVETVRLVWFNLAILRYAIELVSTPVISASGK